MDLRIKTAPIKKLRNIKTISAENRHQLESLISIVATHTNIAEKITQNRPIMR